MNYDNMTLYSEARPRFESGDIVAFSYREPMFSSWYAFKVGVVRAFTKSEYSHIAVVWVTSGRVLLIEAVMPRVRIYPLSIALQEGEDAFHLPLAAAWTREAEDFALGHVGQEYSQIKAMASSFEPWEHGRYTECAGMAIDILNRAGVNLGTLATPSAVVREAQRQGATCALILL